MRKNIKWIISIILIILLSSSLNIFAATKMLANNVTYKDTNVESALNDLYTNNKSKNIQKGSLDIHFSKDWVYQKITFDKPYSTISKMYYDYEGGHSGGSVFISETTTTSFTVGYASFWGVMHDDTINWVAVKQ